MDSDNKSISVTDGPEFAGVLRRIGAMVYDAMLVIAVLAVATIPFFAVAGKTLVPSVIGWPMYLVYFVWQIVVIALFFGVFWTRRGQTLGMQVWKLRVEDQHGKLLTWVLSIKRLLFSAVLWVPGLVCLTLAEQAQSLALKRIGQSLLLLVLANLLVAKYSSTRQTWHERLSGTRVIVQRNLRVLPKDSSA